MTSTVYFGSAKQARLEAKETLPAKLELILQKLNLRDRVKDEWVIIKMHVGNNLGYSTIHPLFVRSVVNAVKEGGGKPFVADVDWDVKGSEARGYTQEVLGCPVYPIGGPNDGYYKSHQKEYKQIREWKVGGLMEDASFLINFAHIKGHPSCSYGGCLKNIALGGMIGETRGQMHDTCQYDPYWFPEFCRDADVMKRIIDACPFTALVLDKDDPSRIHLHIEQCNQCGRCLKIAPEGSLKISPVNFYTFQEACAISSSISLSTFKPGKAVFLALATQMTPVCDCFGFTTLPILPDIGVFGSDDIVAIEQAILDKIGEKSIIEENIPGSMEIVTREGHPLSWIHGKFKDPYKVVEYGAQLGLGSREYQIDDVFPVEKVERSSLGYISAKS